MRSFESLNRKPLAYVKPAEMIDKLGLTCEDEDHGQHTEPVVVKSLWISLSSEYREDKKSAVAELAGEFSGVAVNLPPHMIPIVEEITHDGESLSMIARGHLGICFYKYDNNFGEQAGVFWKDL